MGSTTG